LFAVTVATTTPTTTTTVGSKKYRGNGVNTSHFRVNANNEQRKYDRVYLLSTRERGLSLSLLSRSK
jgi:hypothetical protein